MNREQFLDARCARFRDLIQFLTFYIDPRTPLDKRFDDMVAGGRITINDARYLAGLKETRETTDEIKNEHDREVLIIPKKDWDRKRLRNLIDAIEKYTQTGKIIPKEWIEEYNELVETYSLKKPQEFSF